jgi:aminoglycoside/choline kinase family phosphotransferase
MVKNDRIYFIDFQGARMGPIQYDLASLLIDPYVDLPQDIQTRLLAYAVERLQHQMKLNADNFKRCYRFCCLTRNLQILGAFGHLTRVKGKMQFEKYIPAAARTLAHNLKDHEDGKLPMLSVLANTVIAHDRIKTLGRKK